MARPIADDLVALAARRYVERDQVARHHDLVEADAAGHSRLRRRGIVVVAEEGARGALDRQALSSIPTSSSTVFQLRVVTAPRKGSVPSAAASGLRPWPFGCHV